MTLRVLLYAAGVPSSSSFSMGIWMEDGQPVVAGQLENSRAPLAGNTMLHRRRQHSNVCSDPVGQPHKVLQQRRAGAADVQVVREEALARDEMREVHVVARAAAH